MSRFVALRFNPARETPRQLLIDQKSHSAAVSTGWLTARAA
jgi:hypothetical protein